MRHVELSPESVEQALSAYADRQAGAGFLALLPEFERERLPVLQAACRRRGLALAGGIFPALIEGMGFVTRGAWLLHFERMPPYFLLSLMDGEGGGRKVAAAARECLKQCPEEAPRPTLFMLFDGMLPNIASILDDIYLDLANRVEYGGVNAGSETFQPMPCLFDDTRVMGDGVLGVILPGRLAPVLEHGFRLPERAMSATSTEGNRIATIDWRPAFDVYQEIIKAEYGIDLTRENFYEYAVHFPFGIQLANGDIVVRIPVALSDDGSLHCVGEIPENAVLVLLQAPEAGASNCISRLSDKLKLAHGSLASEDLLTFYCAGRRMHLGQDAEKELAELQAATGAAQMAGALSLGEIGSTARWGYPMFHNATLVCASWRMP